MARLIDADELMKYPIRLDHYDKENGNIHFVYGVESVLEYAESLPTVDAVEVVHGEWIKVPEHGDCYYKCSKCGKTLDTYYESDYAFCARCGADMRSEEE